MSHRLFILAGGAVAVVALVAAAHSAPQTPGRTVVVGPAASGSPGAPPGTSPGALPTAAPAAAGRDSPDPIGGLFGELSKDTQRSATGQFTILQELAGALRGWVEHLLRSASGGG